MDEHQPFDDIAALGEPASPDALREIVARHHRARTRALGIALAVALVAGPAVGWAIGHGGGRGQQVATSSPAPAPPGAPAPPPGPPPPCPPFPPQCKAPPTVIAELSTDAAVGQGFDPIDAAQPKDALSHLSVGVFGVPESSPALFVTVQAGPAV